MKYSKPTHVNNVFEVFEKDISYVETIENKAGDYVVIVLKDED